MYAATQQPEILKLKDVAELLQLSPKQVINLCKDSENKIPHIRIYGRNLRFRRSDVDAWFTRQTISAA